MTPLRQQMIAALQLSGKGERTQQTSVLGCLKMPFRGHF
jgi:hypothetical protein